MILRALLARGAALSALLALAAMSEGVVSVQTASLQSNKPLCFAYFKQKTLSLNLSAQAVTRRARHRTDPWGIGTESGCHATIKDVY